METATPPKIENTTDPTIDSARTSQMIPTVVNPTIPAGSKIVTNMARTETTLQVEHFIIMKAKADNIKKDIPTATKSDMQFKGASAVDFNMSSDQATTESKTTSHLSLLFKADSNNVVTHHAEKDVATATDSAMSTSNVSVITKINKNPTNVFVDPKIGADTITESAIKSKTIQIAPEIEHNRMSTKSAIGIQNTAIDEAKVNSSFGPATINKESIATLSNEVNGLQNSKVDTATIFKQTTIPPTVSKTQSKLNFTINNKENVKAVPTGTNDVKKAATGEKSPSTSSKTSSNGVSEAERLSELQAKCRAKGLRTTGSPTNLVHRLVQNEQRERQFEREHERQLMEFQSRKAESERVGPKSSSQATSLASSVTSDSRPFNIRTHVMSPTSHINIAPRHQGSTGTKICSPTMPNSKVPFARTFVSQDIRLQLNGAQNKADNAAVTTRQLVSPNTRVQSGGIPIQIDMVNNINPSAFQDMQLQPTSVSAKIEANKSSSSLPSQDIRVDHIVVTASNETTKAARPIVSQDIRVLPGFELAKTQFKMDARPFGLQNTGFHQVVMPGSTGIVKTTRASNLQDIRSRQAAKHQKTTREADKANYLHKHTWEIKEECEKKGLQKWGSRTTMVTRLLDYHLNSLRAEFAFARDEHARNTNVDYESLLKKDILWYRLECFLEHRQNQIGLASEPHRAASYTAAKECKYSSPRFAKINADELAVLIAREKKMEEEKAKKELELAADTKEMDGEVKLEPYW
ncbi:hypothetical protein BKA65DRAFT_569472 [Rhexocercosporidium sp. MPI-PUGE-AT-0058]|nr:hypothetical protein BKA65DRAFT_569472 [Rhexocercosporidium sp. MPI-PUGE-AT-0058]